MNLSADACNVLNSIPGLFILDKEERVLFMCESLYKQIGYDSLAEICGRNIREVMYHNTAYKVLHEKRPRIADIYLAEGHAVVSSSFPIYDKHGKIEGVLEYDLFQDTKEINSFIDRISSARGIHHFSQNAGEKKQTKYSLSSIKGSSLIILNLKEEIKLAGKTNSTVLITGETGTGKELVAHSIHDISQRSLFNFVKVNCSAIPGELFESEIFGYEEGSFTGAKKGGKKGLAEIADKGTLFLDEIDSLPLSMQAKLLRFIQEKEFMRVGGDKMIHVNTRIIAATNKDLLSLSSEELFRRDLYYRLHVIDIQVKPLRERRSDIPELANSFIHELNHSLGRSLDKHMVKRISDEALQALMAYDWPGNIRELHNVMERGMNHCYEETLGLAHFKDALPETEYYNDLPFFSDSDTLESIRAKAEKHAITKALSTEGITLSEVADKLGISRQMLHRKIKKYRLAT